jgi:hypothetical protein
MKGMDDPLIAIWCLMRSSDIEGGADVNESATPFADVYASWMSELSDMVMCKGVQQALEWPFKLQVTT